jgi:hypothetical protein
VSISSGFLTTASVPLLAFSADTSLPVIGTSALASVGKKL